ncbi:MAG TPA: CBS domain-containing protein [Candidatus Krumholzibacteria bacterium]|nr:CBS domain-containing protein [Candidatus Krumholzibacteria bacterium]HPD70708.1 CBS domain-containing protein [Candidatus Krumholzibacteria bacterium]HRY39592.1 CBS domain-containing protein [Candidatus Krumholzibacteria bacterium]
MRVQDLLNEKANAAVYSVAPDQSVFEAVTEMVKKNVGAMLVVQNDELVGIITERDYLRLVTVQGRTARDTPVHEIMTRSVIYLTPDTSVEEAMAIVTEKRIRHLPVLADDRILGVLSIGDLVKATAKTREMHIRTLEAYIADDYPGPVK